MKIERFNENYTIVMYIFYSIFSHLWWALRSEGDRRDRSLISQNDQSPAPVIHEKQDITEEPLLVFILLV